MFGTFLFRLPKLRLVLVEYGKNVRNKMSQGSGYLCSEVLDTEKIKKSWENNGEN